MIRKKKIKKLSPKKTEKLILLNHIIGNKNCSGEATDNMISTIKRNLDIQKNHEKLFKNHKIVHYITVDDSFNGSKVEVIYPPKDGDINTNRFNRIEKFYTSINI